MSRLIHLLRSSRKESYGFEFKTLRLDGKNVAFNVVVDSIAHRAGLRNGDYILEVNDEAVCGLWQNAVQMKMDMYSKRLDLLVVDDLSSFIHTRRNSFKFENNNNSFRDNDEDRSIVSSRLDLSPRGNKTQLNNSTARISKDHLINDRTSYVSSRSYRTEPSITPKASYSRSSSADLLDSKKTSTPKIKNKIQAIKPVIKFIGAAHFNSSVNLTEAKSKLNEYGKKIRLKAGNAKNELNNYGFNFRAPREGQHLVVNSIPDYPAFEAGIRDGDYILEVNDEIITGLSHNQVVRKILANQSHVDLLVVTDLDAYLNARQIVSHIKDERISDREVNRYYVKKSAETKLGLEVVTNGIISSVEPFSPAEKAGLRKGLKILKINDHNLKEKNDYQIKNLIRANQNYMVIDAIKMFDVNINFTGLNLEDFDPSEIEIFNSTDLNQSKVGSSKTNKFKSQSSILSGKTNSDQSTDDTDTNPDSVSTKNDIYGIKKVVSSASRKEINGHSSKKSNHHEQIYANEPNVKPPSAIYHEIDNLAGSRLVNLIPRPDFDGYGFNLLYDNENNGPAIVENVKPNSPAFNCGLRESDLVLKINNINVANEQYTKIISMIRELKESKGIIKLEVIDKNLYRSNTRPNLNPAATEQEFSLNQLKNHKKEIRFKRCNLRRLPDADAFGFIITPQAKPKFSIYQVEVDSPAYKASLRKSDVIIEVNKQNIRRMKFIDVLKLLKNDSTHETMEILAISREGYDHYKEKNKRFSSKNLANYENTDLYTT